MNCFGESVDNGKDAGVIFRNGQSSDKVKGNVGPGSAGYRNRSQEASWGSDAVLVPLSQEATKLILHGGHQKCCLINAYFRATSGWQGNLEPCQVNTSGRTDGGTNKQLGGPLPGLGS